MNLSKLSCAAALVALMPFTASADESADKKAILEVLKAYEQALNDSDAAAVTNLYTADAVLMAANYKPAEGRETIQKVYEGLFKAVKLDIKFDVDEVVPASDDWAFARTHSKFTIKVAGSDAAPMEDANQELFVLQKVDGKWQIARYSYSSTNPAPQR
jgi:uncharacterized protein (TIGR02246 family)